MRCFHHNDLDGRCAAAIVNKFYTAYEGEQIQFLECDYSKILELPDIQPDESVFIVDFSLPTEMMNKILTITSNVVLADHHKTQVDRVKEYVGNYTNISDYSGGSKAGCMLIWEYFCPDEDPPMAVQYTSDYDTWTFDYGDDTKYFMEGMLLEDQSPQSDIWEDFLHENGSYLCEEIVDNGAVCSAYRDRLAEDMCANWGWETEFDGHKCFVVFSTALRSSRSFGDRIKEYPICAMVVVSKDNYVVRLYSEQVDVGEIAKNHGGGGHRGASGFHSKILPEEFRGER